VLDDAAGEPVSGILLFSDGRNTGGTAPPEAARRAAGLGVPVYAFAPAADSRAKDLSIIDVHSSGRVALGDLARVTVLIESHGLDKRQASVQLKEGERVVDREAVSLLGSEQQQVHLTFEATNEGPHRLTVEIPPLEGEPEYLHANNTDATHVEVTREKLRVLYVEGLPRWDFRFLKNAMRRDHGLGGRASDAPDLVLESEWQRLPPAPDGARLPASPGDLKDYHAIILGDASPQLLAPEWLAAVKEAVRERGVGLIILCGPLYMPHAYGAQLADLLPVRMHAGAAGLEAPSYRPFRPALTPEGQLHEVMRLYDEQDRNAAIWATMPPCYWCAAASRPAPGATVLASVAGVMGARGNVPLIAYHQAGEGRVLFVGTDATWRWRQNTGDRFFYRFWGQALWFVARRAQPGDAVTSLTVAPVRAQCGDEMRIELLAYAKSGEPLREERVSVGLIGPAGTDRIELIPDAGGVGRYTGRYVASVAGDYRFTFDPADGRDPVRASASVREALAEFRRPDVDRDTLRMLAEVTGGTSAALSDLASVGDELEGEPEWVEIHREAGLWDNWLTLSLLVLVYSADVGLRRMRGMS